MSDNTPKKATDEDIAVGSRIATLRQASGLSQTAVAKTLGVSFQQVQKYESGKNRVGAGRLQAIASLLGVPVSTLFGDAQEPGEVESVPLPALKLAGTAELVRVYASIEDEDVRKDVLAIVKSAAKLAAARKTLAAA